VVRVTGVSTAELYVMMEVVWPCGVALRGVVSNRPPVPWLKTVVLDGVGEVETVISAGVGWGDGRWPGGWPLPCEASEVIEVASEPGPVRSPGIGLGDTRLLPRRCLACRRHEPSLGARG
jgi:hypothetical protein